MKRNGAKHKKNGRAKMKAAGYGKKSRANRISRGWLDARFRDGEEWRPGRRDDEAQW